MVGAGWIGCEVAASARGLGVEVTVIEQAGAPLEGVPRDCWAAADGHVTAAMHVDDWDAIGPVRELVEAGGPLPVARTATAPGRSVTAM